MTQKAGITVTLLGLAALAGTALALGVGRPPRPVNPGVALIRQEARFPGRKLFTDHKCVVCHGSDGGGTEMGPGLGAVAAEYLAAAGGDLAAARARLLEYMRDPLGSPRLRRDTTLYPNPMPSATSVGLQGEALEKVVDYVLGMKPPAVAVGGDASDR